MMTMIAESSRSLFLVGASGHAKVVIDAVEKQGRYEIAYLIDENPLFKGQNVFSYRVIGGKDELLSENYRAPIKTGFVAIGDNQIRCDIALWLVNSGFELATIVHPSAQIGRDVVLGCGSVIMANAVVNAGTRIASNVIVNTSASVDHDCEIGASAHIAPGVRVCGGVVIGDRVLIGVGASIVPNICIGTGAIVGAGATVVHDVPANARMAGTPARPLNHQNV